MICPSLVFLVRGSYYTAAGCDVIHDVFVLFTFAIVEVIWFDTSLSDQCLTLYQVMHINKVSDETFGVWHVSERQNDPLNHILQLQTITVYCYFVILCFLATSSG